MYLIRKKLKDFSAAHRLVKSYTGKCKDLHGHNYVATVLLAASQLDAFDFVIDFNDIKYLCDAWLLENFDHATLICEEDAPLLDFVRAQQQKYYLIPDRKNTTAEVIAEHLFHIFSALFKTHYPRLSLIEVEVAETATSKAIYRQN